MPTSDTKFLNLRVTSDSAALKRARADARKSMAVESGSGQKGTRKKVGPDKVQKGDVELIDEMIAAGLVPAEAKSEALIRITWPSGSGCPRANYVFWKMFTCSRLGCTFPESDECPYDHMEVVRGYVSASQGAISAEAILQASKDIEMEDDYGNSEYPILVQFIAGNQLFRFRVYQFGGIPDGFAVESVVNCALAQTGERRRFVPIDVQDLGGDVFAEPKRLTEFCTKNNIHVYPMRQARARKVETLQPIWDELNALLEKRHS